MKRVFRFSTCLLLAWISFSLLTCGQSQFTGTAIKPDIADVSIKFRGGEFESIYSPGSRNSTMTSVPSKYSMAVVKVLTGEKGLNVKIRGSKATPSANNALEFVHKLNLRTGENIIPVVVYREDEKTGETFEIRISRKASEGALRLVHLKCKYKNYAGEDIETDDFIDELPYNEVYERRFANDTAVSLEVASPELDTQRLEIRGVEVVPSSITPGEYKTYTIPLDSADSTPIDIIVYDSNKDLSQSFHLSFSPLSREQKESTKIDLIKLTTEEGDFFEFDKLDMAAIEPYTKGVIKKVPVKIENIYKLNDILFAWFGFAKPTLSIKTKEPGAKVEIVGRWNEVDHDQTSRSGLRLPQKQEWNTIINRNVAEFSDYRRGLPLLEGHNTDMEFKFCPYTQGKMDLLFKVTSPDGSKVKYYEVKYGFISALASFFDLQPFQAVVENSKDTKLTVVKSSEEEGLYNVYVPYGSKSVRFIANDRLNINFATGYRRSYPDLWDYRFYLKVDDGDFSRTHPSKDDADNYKEITLTSISGQEEHRLSVVSYQSGELKNGVFVDEYGREDGVIKIQKNFRFRFIKEDRRVAPALTVLKVEGTPSGSMPSAIRGKVWPTLSFRPAVSENTVALLKSGVDYKLKMLKTDDSAKIYIGDQEITTKETFTQQLQKVDSNFPDVIKADVPNTVGFYTYEIKQAEYYENGELKATTIPITIEKDGNFRQYQLNIVPVDPDENDTKVTVLDSHGGSARAGTTVLYKEHEANKELQVDTNGKLYKADFRVLGTTGADGILSGRGKLKAGRYYDIYALGDDVETADSMIEHYYVTGMPGEIIDLMQMSLTQSGGSDYHGTAPIRGSCPVRLMKQVKTPAIGSSPAIYNDGAYFFFRQQEASSGGIGGGMGGGGSGSWQLKPCNLTCGDAHIKMEDASAGAYTDMVVWFDVSSGNTVEPVSWGPNGVTIGLDNTPFMYTLSIEMTEYNRNGQISMTKTAVEQQARFKFNFPSGVYDLVLVAYDVAGNRLERHQLVSIEGAKMMEGQNPGFDTDDDSRKVKFENFRVSLFRWPIKMNIFEHKEHFENLFGMPWTEYTPPDGQGDAIKTPSTYIVIGRGFIADELDVVNISGVDLYRRCVEDNTPFKKVGSTIPQFRASAFGSMDTDFTLEEGKTYQYKMVAFIDEGSSIETEYLAEVKVPPAFLYFLDNIKVEGQGGDVPDGSVYKYNANKIDKNIPLLKTKKYPSSTPDKDKKRVKIDYSARLSNPKLWDKDAADEIDFGITLYTRNGEVVFASKCAVVFDDDEGEVLLVYLPLTGRYFTLKDLIEMKVVPRHYTMDDLVTFNRETGVLTIKDKYLRIGDFNWAQLYGSTPTFNYEPGNTYYWDIVNWGRIPIGGYVSALSVIKTFDAKKKEAPHEKYVDNDGDIPMGGLYLDFGNGDYDGGNSYNGRCRFTVVEE